ncbi:MAG: hypothetical protein MUF20_09985, partial [Methylotetracoccus sp.]|nr:hypothetical protein [Methylotetracoccus sp.]
TFFRDKQRRATNIRMFGGMSGSDGLALGMDHRTSGGRSGARFIRETMERDGETWVAANLARLIDLPQRVSPIFVPGTLILRNAPFSRVDATEHLG